MSLSFVAEKSYRKQHEWMLPAVLIVLLGVGMVMLFSASWYRGQSRFDSPFQFVLNQGVSALIGVVLAFVASRLSLETIRTWIPWMMLGAVLLMGLTFIPSLGQELLGGRRWIIIAGVSFQPSELLKPVLILYLASILEKKQAKLDRPAEGLIQPFVLVFFLSALIYFQNNFSTAMFLMVLSIAIFFAAGVALRWFFFAGLMVVPFVVVSLLAHENKTNRILMFLQPESDPYGSGYQVLSSLNSLQHGGFAGLGIGQGVHKIGVLPEANSDYIFAILGEELGFLGVVAVVGLFALFAWRGYSIAAASEKLYPRLVAFGVTSSIVLQAFINIAVVANLMPSTGLPLPFFSSGGSSLMMTLAMCGLLFNVSRSSVESGGQNG